MMRTRTLTALAVAAVCVLATACATTSVGQLGARALSYAGKALYGAELLFHVGARAAIAAVDTGVLKGERRTQVDNLFEPSVRLLSTARAAYVLGDAPTTTGQALAAVSLMSQAQAVFLPLKPVAAAPQAGAQPPVAAVLAAAGGLVTDVGPLAAQAEDIFASNDDQVVRGAIADLQVRNDQLIDVVRGRLAARSGG